MSHNIKKKQNILFGILILTVFVSCLGVYYLLDNSEIRESIVEKRTDLPVDTVNAQEIWMVRVEEQNKSIQTRLNYIENMLVDAKKNEEESVQKNSNLKEELFRLKKELKTVGEGRVERIPASIQNPTPEYIEQKRSPLQEIVVDQRTKKTHHVDQTIPAGTTVKALLVSSVDAPCGALSINDPYPVKLRIIDDGHLPKGVKAQLKGGLVIAAVYGELSSERVYMRLERLTKISSDGEYVETAIAGFVSGEDGKFGVRGTVVDKSSKMVGNAAMSGVFSGINQYFQALARTSSFDQCCDNKCKDYGYGILREGGLAGTSNAFDMLTDYYIKRAEQIKPVIQVDAGRIVDITFTHGAELGDLYTREKVKQIREQSRNS